MFGDEWNQIGITKDIMISGELKEQFWSILDEANIPVLVKRQDMKQ